MLPIIIRSHMSFPVLNTVAEVEVAFEHLLCMRRLTQFCKLWQARLDDSLLLMLWGSAARRHEGDAADNRLLQGECWHLVQDL